MTQPDGTTWHLGYDPLGQLAQANLTRTSDNASYPGRQYHFQYDTIGNRLSATPGDTPSAATHPEVTAYTPNALNQYTAITRPAYAEAAGEAHEAAAIAINGQSPSRLGPSFHYRHPVDNSGPAPVETPLTITATEGTATDTETRTALTLPASEAPQHDADGNLTQDALWLYTWDAENRLIGMENRSTLPAGKRVKLAFTYDSQHRRIRKQVWIQQPAAPHAWLLSQDRRFCYDGWNLILEMDPDGTAFRQYLWGLDLSQTPQGAGGVGGLLCITARSLTPQPSPVHYFPACDGNGNLTGLTTAATGTESATFTYDPFGQPLTATGPAAKANPFGFSTKYTDPETQLCYYGHRYYNPADGRWLGRDPIGERGGLNLHGMVGNDAVDQVDFLGLWSIVKRDGAALASICSDRITDNWSELSKIENMSLRYKDKWLRDEKSGTFTRDTHPILGKIYSIPNTIVIRTSPGDGGTAVKIKKDKDALTGESNILEGVWRSAGFRVIREDEMPLSELEKPSIFGWIFNGHGNQRTEDEFQNPLPHTQWHFKGIVAYGRNMGGISGLAEHGITPSVFEEANKINHPLWVVVVYACSSASDPWESIVSSNGRAYLWDYHITGIPDIQIISQGKK